MYILVSTFTSETLLLKENKAKFKNINNYLLSTYNFFSTVIIINDLVKLVIKILK